MLVKVITTISSIEIQMIEKKLSFTDLLYVSVYNIFRYAIVSCITIL